jgi:uncharacterized protein (DUF2235 family)
MYNNENFVVCEEFKNTFSKPCDPHFIGIWDTVSSLGYIYASRKYYDPTLNPEIVNAYHAISINEKRKKFQVVLWDETKKAEKQTVEQVWFAGVHSDVGGWYKERGLSDIAFAWMMDKASACGLRLKDRWTTALKQDALDVMHESRVGCWRLWPAIVRGIPEGAKIHKSVIDRMAKDKDYNPTLPQNYEIVENKNYHAPTHT